MTDSIVTLKPVDTLPGGRKYDRVDPVALAEVAQELAAQPGQWYEIVRFPRVEPSSRQAAYLARDIREGNIRALKGAEAMSRTIEGDGVVYARFPAGRDVELSPAERADVAAVDLDELAEALVQRLLKRLLAEAVAS